MRNSFNRLLRALAIIDCMFIIPGIVIYSSKVRNMFTLTLISMWYKSRNLLKVHNNITLQWCRSNHDKDELFPFPSLRTWPFMGGSFSLSVNRAGREGKQELLWDSHRFLASRQEQRISSEEVALHSTKSKSCNERLSWGNQMTERSRAGRPKTLQGRRLTHGNHIFFQLRPLWPLRRAKNWGQCKCFTALLARVGKNFMHPG